MTDPTPSLPAPPRGAPPAPASSFRRPQATQALVAVIVATSVADWLFPGLELVDRFAKVNERIRAGEVWRLLTPILVHGGVVHLAMNMTALLSVGKAAELLVGPRRMLAVMLGGAVVATATSAAFTAAPSVGASGGIAALIGLLLAFGLRRRALLPAAVSKQLVGNGLFAAVMTALLGALVPRVDNAAHLGGFVAGLVAGAWFPPSKALLVALGRPRDAR